MDDANPALVSMRYLALALLCLSVPVSAQSAERTLWLWHGAHDLRGYVPVAGERVSVAYLSRTLIVETRGVRVIPRRDAIYLDPEMERVAVVHMELGPHVDVERLRRARREILRALTPVFGEEANGVQFDFDAPRSMRGEYTGLLQDIAEAKPEAWTLSMTALGSWCTAQGWLSDAPIDFAVPMLFGPGHQRHETLLALENRPLAEPLCRHALGLREHQPAPAHHSGRFYVFGQGTWDSLRAERALRTLRAYSLSSSTTTPAR